MLKGRISRKMCSCLHILEKYKIIIISMIELRNVTTIYLNDSWYYNHVFYCVGVTIKNLPAI